MRDLRERVEIVFGYTSKIFWDFHGLRGMNDVERCCHQ